MQRYDMGDSALYVRVRWGTVEGDIDNNSSLLGFSNTLSQVEGAISQCNNAVEHCIQRLTPYK